MRAPWCLLLVAVVLFVLGCDDERRPWEAPPGAPPPPPSPPPSAASTGSRWLDASWAREAEAEATAEPPALDVRPPPPGGLWASCADGFVPGVHGARPAADLARLSMLCGPPTGLRPIGPVEGGDIDNRRPARFRYGAKPGRCYRVFAVAPSLERLTLSARVGDAVVARAEGRGWLHLEPARPFCLLRPADALVVELRGDGSGSFALQLWGADPPGR